MLLGLLFLIALVTVPLAGGRLNALADLEIRRPWLAIAAIGIQVLIISVIPDVGSEQLHKGIHMGTYVLFGAFMWSNRRIPGLPVIALGGALNMLAIAANGGVMPADPELLVHEAQRAGAEGFVNSGAIDNARLAFLGDNFATPDWFPLHNVYSVGDAVIFAGVMILLHVVGGSRLDPRGRGRSGRGGRLLREAAPDGPSRRFFAAHAQSCFGTGIAHVALPLLAFEHSGTAWAVTAVLLPELLPAIVLGPVLGALVDRVGWRACAVGADVLRMGAFVVLAFTDSLAVMIVAAAVVGVGTALFMPSALAAVPQLVETRRRAPAMRLFGALDDLGLTAGPALAAALLAVVSPHVLLSLNAFTFGISALLIASGARSLVRGSAGWGRRRRVHSLPSLLTDARAGMREAIARRELRALLACSASAVLCVGITNVGEVVLAREVLGVGGSGLALLVAAGGTGTLLGSLAARTNSSWGWRRAYLTGLGCMAIDLVLCAVIESYWLLVPVFVLGGFGNGLALVHDRLLLADAVRQELHGRIFALQKTLTSTAFAGSYVAAGALIATGGVQSAFAFASVALIAVMLAAAPRLRTAWPAPPPRPVAVPAPAA
jgi:MFS family permease